MQLPLRLMLTWQWRRLLFSLDGSLLSAFSVDGFAKVWRIADWSSIQSFDAGSAEIQFLAISPNDQILMLPSADGLVFYSLIDGQVVRQLRGYYNSIEQAALSPQGGKAAALISGAGPEASSLEVWTYPEGQRLYLLTRVGALNFAWSPDGNLLANRWVECSCGLSLDRDVNAAINILKRAGRARWDESIAVGLRLSQEAPPFSRKDTGTVYRPGSVTSLVSRQSPSWNSHFLPRTGTVPCLGWFVIQFICMPGKPVRDIQDHLDRFLHIDHPAHYQAGDPVG